MSPPFVFTDGIRRYDAAVAIQRYLRGSVQRTRRTGAGVDAEEDSFKDAVEGAVNRILREKLGAPRRAATIAVMSVATEKEESAEM